MYIYTCTHTRRHTYRYIYTHVHVYVQTHRDTQRHPHSYAYIHRYTHIYMHTRIHTSTQTPVQTHVYSPTQNNMRVDFFLYTHIFTHTHIHTYKGGYFGIQVRDSVWYSPSFTNTHAHTHTYSREYLAHNLVAFTHKASALCDDSWPTKHKMGRSGFRNLHLTSPHKNYIEVGSFHNHVVMHNNLPQKGERWGAGVEYHFQEISWNLRPVVNGT